MTPQEPIDSEKPLARHLPGYWMTKFLISGLMVVTLAALLALLDRGSL
jgi:hypothetical protein